MKSKYERQTSVIRVESVKWFRDFEKRAENSAILIERPASSNREIVEVEFLGKHQGS